MEWSDETERRLEEFACGWDSEDYDHVVDIRAALSEIHRQAQLVLYWEAEATDARSVRDDWMERAEKAEADRDEVQRQLVRASFQLQKAEAENEALRAERDEAQSEQAAEYLRRIAAEAERDRLREALRKVQDKAYDGQNYDAMHAFNVLLSIHTLALRALAAQGSASE